MRFFLDEDLPPSIAVIARNQGLDVSGVHETGRHGRSDQEQLEYASSHGRILVTRNRDDFIALTRLAYQVGSPHTGVMPERLLRVLRLGAGPAQSVSQGALAAEG